MSFWLAAGAALVVAGPAAGQPKKITNPDWLERPSAETFAEHYPGLAAALEIEGRASIACGVNADGELVDCEVASEQPADLGFGAAALAMSADFKMKPQMEDGVAVDGGYVRIPLRFLLPKGDDAGAAGPPPDAPPALVEAARGVVDAMRLVEKVVTEDAHSIAEAGDGVPATVRQAAVEARRAAWERARGDLREAYARALASVYSEDELAGIATFARSHGEELWSEDKALAGALQQAGNDATRALRAPARAAFCAKVACPTAAELAHMWRPVESRDGRLDNPQWLYAPDEATVFQAGAGLAMMVGVSGAVRMTCEVGEEGELEGCKADEELPRGLGYGAAAVSLAEYYRLSPIQRDVAKGRKVTVRVGFTPPALPAAYEPPKPRSAAALELARRLSEASEGLETSRRDIEVQILGFESHAPKEVDKAVYAALIDAYRVGAMKATEEVIDLQVKVWAARRTEAQLQTLATFQASPAGKAMRERAGAVDVAIGKAHMFVAQKVTAEARAAFCKDRACDAPSAQPTAASPEPSTRKP